MKAKTMKKSKKIRVCLVNALFYPFLGGVEKHMLELSKHLVKQGVDVHIMTGRLSELPKEQNIEGVKVHRIECTEIRIPGLYPPPLVLSATVQQSLAALDEKYKFDLIHLQNRWFPDFDSALIYAKSANKPFILTLHNARPVGIALHYTVLGGLYDQVIGQQVLKSADRIISVSNWAIGDVSKYGISKSKFTHIPNGIEGSDYTVCTDPKKARLKAIRNKLSLQKGPLLLFVGRVIKQKGLEYLIKAMPEILTIIPNAQLIIVGKGDKLEELKKLTNKLKLNDKVIFPGFVDNLSLRKLLSSADLFVLPSLWEVLPIAVLEAMASGKPIVCTDVGGNRELVDQTNGVVVPKRNSSALAGAIISVLSNEQRMKQMGKASRKRAIEHFNWQTIAMKTKQLYKQEIEKKKNSKENEINSRGIVMLNNRLAKLRGRLGMLYVENYYESKKLIDKISKSIGIIPRKINSMIYNRSKKGK